MSNNPEEFFFSGKAAENNWFPVKNIRHSGGNENTYALFCSYSSLLSDVESCMKMRTKYILPGIRLLDRKRVFYSTFMRKSFPESFPD